MQDGKEAQLLRPHEHPGLDVKMISGMGLEMSKWYSGLALCPTLPA